MLIHPLLTDIEKPARMNNPFNYEPHPLCIMAAEEVKRWIEADPTLKEDADRGKMFGVLVVEDSGGCSFLATSNRLSGKYRKSTKSSNRQVTRIRNILQTRLSSPNENRCRKNCNYGCSGNTGC